MSATPGRRVDAAENRRRIVAAARTMIVGDEDGADDAHDRTDRVNGPGSIRLNAIAKRAGVGQGTLYRHFPTREDLLAEVYRVDVDELVATAPALLAEHDPIDALALWFERVADYARVKRGVFAAVEAGVERELASHSQGPIGEAITMLLDAGRVDGSFRPDVDARDVVLLIGCLTRLGPDEWDSRAGRLLAVVRDGIRRPGSPGPGD